MMDDDRDRASRVADALDDIGQDRLADMLADSMSKLADGDVQPTVSPASPPSDERRYWLLASDLEAARTSATVQGAMRAATETALELSPRRVAHVEFAALTDLLPTDAAAAVDRLREVESVTVSDLECYGTVTQTHCEDVFDLYSNALLTARFEDADGTTIASRDDTAQLRFWLPESESERLDARLGEDVGGALRQD